LCEDCLSFAVVAAEFWSLQKKCGSQRTNRVRQTLVLTVKNKAMRVCAPPTTSRARQAQPTCSSGDTKLGGCPFGRLLDCPPNDHAASTSAIAASQAANSASTSAPAATTAASLPADTSHPNTGDRLATKADTGGEGSHRSLQKLDALSTWAWGVPSKPTRTRRVYKSLRVRMVPQGVRAAHKGNHSPAAYHLTQRSSGIRQP